MAQPKAPAASAHNFKFHTAFVNWHQTSAVFSIDFHKSGRIATGGADKLAKIWRLTTDPFKVDFLSVLSGPGGVIHTVRFSPNGDMLATVCDNGFVKLWRHDPDWKPVEGGLVEEDHEYDVERWVNFRRFKGYQQGIYDIAWSPNQQYVISGSLDNTAQIWDVSGNKLKLVEFKDHLHYVQGVAWDPLDAMVVTQSSDRALRVFDRKKRSMTQNTYAKKPLVIKNRTIIVKKKPPKTETEGESKEKEAKEKDLVVVIGDNDENNVSLAKKKLDFTKDVEMADVKTDAATGTDLTTKSAEAKADDKPKANVPEGYEEVSVRLFHDENLTTFFRRCSFSPDGRLLFAPAGILIEDPHSDDLPQNVTWVFSRADLSTPAMYIPTGSKASLIVRCNPILFKKIGGAGSSEHFDLPYRVVFAIASFDSVAIYDTEHLHPIALIRDAHYVDHTDLSWSTDGHTLAISSSDGYCSFAMFERGQLGEPLPEEEQRECLKHVIAAQVAVHESAPEEKGEKKEGDQGEAMDIDVALPKSPEKNEATKEDKTKPTSPLKRSLEASTMAEGSPSKKPRRISLTPSVPGQVTILTPVSILPGASHASQPPPSHAGESKSNAIVIDSNSNPMPEPAKTRIVPQMISAVPMSTVLERPNPAPVTPSPLTAATSSPKKVAPGSPVVSPKKSLASPIATSPNKPSASPLNQPSSNSNDGVLEKKRIVPTLISSAPFTSFVAPSSVALSPGPPSPSKMPPSSPTKRRIVLTPISNPPSSSDNNEKNS